MFEYSTSNPPNTFDPSGLDPLAKDLAKDFALSVQAAVKVIEKKASEAGLTPDEWLDRGSNGEMMLKLIGKNVLKEVWKRLRGKKRRGGGGPPGGGGPNGGGSSGRKPPLPAGKIKPRGRIGKKRVEGGASIGLGKRLTGSVRVGIPIRSGEPLTGSIGIEQDLGRWGWGAGAGWDGKKGTGTVKVWLDF